MADYRRFYIPNSTWFFAGDALGKPLKGTRLAAKIAKLERSIVAAIAATKAAKASIASKAIRKARNAAAKARIAAKRKKCATCKIEGNIFDTDLPTGGSWKGKTKGHGNWEPDWTSDRGKIIEAANKKAGFPPHSSIKYNKGYPDFSKYADQSIKIPNMSGKPTDFTEARNVVRKKLNNPKWKEDPSKWTWHHSEDGATMQLIPKDLHSKAGVPHTGGRSIVTDPGY